MNKKSRLLFVGNDTRTESLASILNNEYDTDFFIPAVSIDNTNENKDLEEKVKQCDIIILPLPVTKDNIHIFYYSKTAKKVPLKKVAEYANKFQKKVFAGAVSEKIKKLFENITDYYNDESLQILNAATTAEAAMGIAIKEYKKAIFESKCLVIGYGRIGKQLSARLKAFGADTTIVTRKKEALSDAQTYGLVSVNTNFLADIISDKDIIFNTAPSKILKADMIDLIKKDSLIIDLASAPGGTDFEYAEKANIKAIHALSLPGIYSPESAANHLSQTLKSLLEVIILNKEKYIPQGDETYANT